jgi:acetylglutamate kinase
MTFFLLRRITPQNLQVRQTVVVHGTGAQIIDIFSLINLEINGQKALKKRVTITNKTSIYNVIF